MSLVKKICVFCGSNYGNTDEYRDSVREFGRLLVRNDITLVYGGGNVGLMGELARTVMELDGEVIGVIPKKIYQLVEHIELSELHIVNDMHERKAKMYNMANAYVALPGGIGTLEEISEIFTWYQLGIHKKPIGILNINHFYDMLMSFLDHMVLEGFLKQAHRDLINVDTNPHGLLDKIASFRALTVSKWMS